MNTSHDFSELRDLLHTLPARLRLVADYVARKDALEREAAAELLDECAARLEAQRDRLTRCSEDLHHALGCGSQLVIIPASKEALPS